MCFFTAGALRALKKPVRKSGCISSERCCQEVSLLLGRYLRAHENFWRGTDHWKGMNFFHQTDPLEDKTAFPIPLAFPLPLNSRCPEREVLGLPAPWVSNHETLGVLSYPELCCPWGYAWMRVWDMLRIQDDWNDTDLGWRFFSL